MPLVPSHLVARKDKFCRYCKKLQPLVKCRAGLHKEEYVFKHTFFLIDYSPKILIQRCATQPDFSQPFKLSLRFYNKIKCKVQVKIGEVDQKLGAEGKLRKICLPDSESECDFQMISINNHILV